MASRGFRLVSAVCRLSHSVRFQMANQDKNDDNKPKELPAVVQDWWFSLLPQSSSDLPVPSDELDEDLLPDLPPERKPSRLAQWWQKWQADRDQKRQAKLNAKIDQAPDKPPVYANDEEPPPRPPRRWTFQPRWPNRTTFKLSVSPSVKKVMLLCFILVLVCGAVFLAANKWGWITHRLWPVVSAQKTKTTTSEIPKPALAPVPAPFVPSAPPQSSPFNPPPFVPSSPPPAVQPSVPPSMPSDAEIARIGKATGSKASVEEVKLIIRQLQAAQQSRLPLVAPAPPPSK